MTTGDVINTRTHKYLTCVTTTNNHSTWLDEISW